MHLCSKSRLVFFSALLQQPTDYGFRFTYYSQLFSEVATPTSILACIAVVLALPVDIWWPWSFTISIVDSFLTVFYRLRQLSIAKYSYAESIPPFLLLNCCARLVPTPCFDWERVTGHKMLPIIPALCSELAHAYYSQNYAGILGASLLCMLLRSYTRIVRIISPWAIFLTSALNRVGLYTNIPYI